MDPLRPLHPFMNSEAQPLFVTRHDEYKDNLTDLNWSRAFQKYLSNVGVCVSPMRAPIQPQVITYPQISTPSIQNLINDSSNESFNELVNASFDQSSIIKVPEYISSYTNRLPSNQSFNMEQPNPNSLPSPVHLLNSLACQTPDYYSRGSIEHHVESNIEITDSTLCFPCGWLGCNQMFTTRTGLATHCSSHLANFLPQINQDRANNKKRKDSLHCCWKNCNEMFSKLRDLAKHMALESHVGQTPFLPKEYEEEVIEQNKKPKRYACSYPECGRLFADSSNRKKHERTHDVNRERFYCNVQGCTKSYSTKTDLNIHMKAHKGEFPHKCTYPNCGKVFVRLSELYAHERSHDNILPHLCTTCGKRFREKSRLKQHEDTHSESALHVVL